MLCEVKEFSKHAQQASLPLYFDNLGLKPQKRTYSCLFEEQAYPILAVSKRDQEVEEDIEKVTIWSKLLSLISALYLDLWPFQFGFKLSPLDQFSGW